MMTLAVRCHLMLEGQNIADISRTIHPNAIILSWQFLAI